MKKKRILSGMRPTGKLHWGNYFGALKNWLNLQETHECYFFVADWHALTTDFDRSANIPSSVHDVMLDWLAVGLDPQKSTLFLQSFVPQHAELHLILSMITPLGWLERVPSYKETREQMGDRDLGMYGFLGYPVLQTADILLYQAEAVPVGEDQLAHLELSREILRRFHFLMHADNVFVEPKPMLTPQARIPGTDGRKMSKSYGNAIYIADDEATVRHKMMNTITDPARQKRTDPGNPDVCNIFAYHKLYTDDQKLAWVDTQCRTAGIGCVDCKKICIENALNYWRPIRERREVLEKTQGSVMDILKKGSQKAELVARATMDKVKQAMGMKYE